MVVPYESNYQFYKNDYLIYLEQYDTINIAYLPTFNVISQMQLKYDKNKDERSQISCMNVSQKYIDRWYVQDLEHIYVQCQDQNYKITFQDCQVKNIKETKTKVPEPKQKYQQIRIKTPHLIEIDIDNETKEIQIICEQNIDNPTLTNQNPKFYLLIQQSQLTSVVLAQLIEDILILITNYGEIFKIDIKQWLLLPKQNLNNLLRLKQTQFKCFSNDQYLQPFKIIKEDEKYFLLINKQSTGQLTDKLMYKVEFDIK